MSWASALTSGAKAFYRTASDAYAASTFNRNAYNEASRESVKYHNYDIDCNADFDPEEEWTAVTKVPRDPVKEPYEEHWVQQYSGKFKQLRFKITEKAAKATSEAAGVSLDYTQWALKYVALEMAHDVGWISNCKTATDAVRAVQARFSVLEDIKTAYQSGSSAGRQHRSVSSSTNRSSGSFDASRIAARSYEPVSGVFHPNRVQVPSNLDDTPIISDAQIRANMAMRQGKPIYDPETGAELEVVFEPVLRSVNALRNRSETAKSEADQRNQNGEFQDVDLNSDDEAEDFVASDREDEQEEQKDIIESKVIGEKVFRSGPIIGSRDSEELKAGEANRRQKYQCVWKRRSHHEG